MYISAQIEFYFFFYYIYNRGKPKGANYESDGTKRTDRNYRKD